MENLNDIGVIGISVMGSGIAQNLARRGLHTSVYNRDFRKITTFFENIKDDRTES
ncbi:MAG: hypothetical protein LBL63_05570, partial [Clostridiales Family XIII bacterium]|nr:hypothetical protein [Clostridiales Family XIII bacterium]